MADAIGEAKKGLAAALGSIEGLRVYDYEPDGVHEFPAAIVRLESREPVETLGGGAVRGSMRVEVLAPATDARQADAMLGAFIEPQGARSIEAAATADRTWGGTVDDGCDWCGWTRWGGGRWAVCSAWGRISAFGLCGVGRVKGRSCGRGIHKWCEAEML